MATRTNCAAAGLIFSRLIFLSSALLLTFPLTAAERPETDAALAKAAQLQREEKFVEAQPILEDTVTTDPGSQKAALLHGSNLRHLDRYGESEKELKRTLELGSGSWEAQHAAYLLADVQHMAGKTSDALATIDALEAAHPDSSWLPEAWVVEAKIAGTDQAAAEAMLETHNEGLEAYRQILWSRDTNGTSASISALRDLAASYGGQPIALQARESIGHLLTKTTNTQEAIDVFQGLIDELGEKAPGSRILQAAKERVAALHHRAGRREEALQYYQESIAVSAEGNMAENAVIKSAGVAFELLQHEAMANRPVTFKQWEDVRRMMSVARQDGASTHTRLISELMELESYLWSGHYNLAVSAGDRFIDNYSTMTVLYRKEVATAYVTLSRVAKDLENYQESILFAQAVLEMYPEEIEIWPKMDHLQRAYFDLVEALYSTGQVAAGDAQLAEFTGRFPASPYLRAIELAKKGNLYVRRQSQSGSGN